MRQAAIATQAASRENSGVSSPARRGFIRAAVAASQRERLLDGVAQAVAAKGYSAVTVGDIVAAAAVSRRTFYEQFTDIESCFLTAFQTGMELLLRQIRDAVRSRSALAWRDRARVSVEAYLEALAARPAAAWAFSIGALGAGSRVLAHRALVLDRWVQQWRQLQEIARRAEPDIAETPPDQLLVLVGGIEELVRECLLARGAEQLPRLAPRVTEIALSTLGG
ncbi:MAG: TetR/AcrR family transcriptional regulator [Acidimicrobiales bacterium]